MVQKNIFLTGFMGSGKSTIGKYLANSMTWSFVDLDQTIEQTYGESILKMFETCGEETFRTRETNILNLIANRSQQVVALGGGAILSNLDLIRTLGVSIYLKASPAVVIDRLKSGRERRPMLKGKTDAEILQLMEDRESVYSKSDFVILTDQLSIPDVVQKIAVALRSIGVGPIPNLAPEPGGDVSV